MILGYIFVGIVTGLIGAITAAVMGASFWVVICVYTLAGSVCAIGFAAVQMVLLARAGQDTYLIPADEMVHRVTPICRSLRTCRAR